MADNLGKLSSTDGNTETIETEFPPPPPSDSIHPSMVDHSFIPVPPPKESFSKFHEQRQANELKRLYRHMHPELRNKLEHTVTRDLSELLSTDEPNQQTSTNLEVQSMRWIFENWNLDSIGEHQAGKKLAEEETILGGNVKNTSMKFQGETCVDGNTSACQTSRRDQSKGDVKTALWLFETQPLHSLNKIYPDETDVQEAVLKDPVERGDVKGTKHLFETYSLDEVGRCKSVEENNILQLKSEIQESKGEVKKSIKLFQTEPLCAIRDPTGNIHEIKSVCREETQGHSVNTARWLFETQPLDTIHKDASGVRIIRGISLEEIEKGGVNAAKWIFETQPLDTLKEHTEEGVFQASLDNSEQAAVTTPSSGQTATAEEVLAGDVRSTLWLFETQPMETLKGNFEVGHLKKVDLLSEEKGDVKQRKHIFETCSLDKISTMVEESTEDQNEDNKQREIIKGDVKSYKNLFETIPLDNITQTSSVLVSNQEDIVVGNVKANQTLFETTPLYAIEDSVGNYHEVTSVSREEVISGDVKNYKWMFETKRLDQFHDSPQKVDIIKGITKQEIISGDVGTAKWLFETQPVDVIHQEKNATAKHSSVQTEVSEKGDVKKCRWLFETQPMDKLYDKPETNQEREALVQGDVKSYTWMFETQPLDSFKEAEEQYIKVSSALEGENCKGADVKTTKHLFETEPLDNIASENQYKNIIRYSSRVEIQSGEVSRVKEIFESKPKEGIEKADAPQEENIQKGSVNKFTWLFENCPMDAMDNNKGGFQELPSEKDIQGGDVGGKKFIFETCSIDQIQRESDELEIQKVQKAVCGGDVKSCTMLFETKPLYAIQDKEGEYHEVTSVKKEEIQKGDVRGAKWLFETKPLDMINKDEEVFVIRAVTQEDIEKGCVKSARWRFETEPLDSMTDYRSQARRTVDDVQRGDVQLNKQLFESQQAGQKKYVRLVSVSDVQKGNVRTSTWLFENQPIDSLKGESDEHHGIVTVQREDNQKGDVKRCTWLFESHPLDSLKETETPTATQAQEVIPQANVKSTTWLFESTPLDEFDFKPTASGEEQGRNVKGTLDAFVSCKIIQHKGLVIESFDSGNVKMAKYQLRTQESTEIVKEEILAGNLQRILLQLLHRTDIEPQGLLVEENSGGDLQIAKLNLLNPGQSGEPEEEHIGDDVPKALQVLLNEDVSIKSGIIMEESENGSVKIIIYAISSQCKFNVGAEAIVKGDVKSTIGSLLACTQEQKSSASVIREEKEKGKVGLYKSCIEKGDLEYLRNLQAESEIEALTLSQIEPGQQDLNASTVQHGVTKPSDDMPTGSVGTDCIYVSSIPTFPTMQSEINKKQSSAVADSKHTDSTRDAKNICKIEKEDIGFKSARQTNAPMKEARTTVKHITDKETPVALGQNTANAQNKNSATSIDLQAALLDLRQATEEAKNIQQQVQGKYQKKTQEVQMTNKQMTGNMISSVQSTQRLEECATAKHSTSAMTTVQGTKKSSASLQISTSSTKKVSASEKEEEVEELFEAGQESEMVTSADSSIKDYGGSPRPAKSYLNPFIDSDYNMRSEREERDEDMVRGDVKAAIRALHNASAEQKEIEKEEVVKGNLTSALKSLEKSNINVSKGDFKAAMIYRNAGQSYAVGKKNSEAQQNRNQALLKSVQPSDTYFPPPSAAVTAQESRQPAEPSRAGATKDEPTKIDDSVPKTTQPFINKASEKITADHKNASNAPQRSVKHREKPVPPPKPKHLQASAHSTPHYKPKSQRTPSTSSQSSPTTPVDDRNCKLIGPQDIMSGKDHASGVGLSPIYDKTNLGMDLTQHCVNVANYKNMLYSTDLCQEACIPQIKMVTKDLSSDAHVKASPMAHIGPVLEEHVSNENHQVKSDRSIALKHKTIEDTRRKQSVIVTDNKDARHHPGVVMRVKHGRETEDEKRKRLSVHKDEIMKGNVKAAMDIFENLRKQEELQKILSKVKELEEETSNVDVRSMRGLFEDVQDWIDNGEDEKKTQLKEKDCLKEESFEPTKEDAESVSSVDLAFEDLEKASMEIKELKEQTLARLLDIEETIRKALYTVSNLKSESDIAGLSCLFRESLGTSTSIPPTNNIRKISIISSKAKHETSMDIVQQKSGEALNAQDGGDIKKTELDVVNPPNRAISPTSPSFITIESAARKPAQHNGNCVPSSPTSNALKNGQLPEELFGALNRRSEESGQSEFLQVPKSLATLDPFTDGLEQNTHANLNSTSSPTNSRRQKSVLELTTGSETPKLIGTTVVTEKYEESDQFGNKIIRSKTSTTVTKQSDTQSSSTYEVVTSTPRYEVTASPLLRRHAVPSAENSGSRESEVGVVYVTFGNSKLAKK
ncbi:xin actin-binding repeat-containing protein 1 [Pelodytes ibericus]